MTTAAAIVIMLGVAAPFRSVAIVVTGGPGHFPFDELVSSCRERRSGELGGRDEKLIAVNDDHDPRYSLANERTFLAWIRTSLGLLAVAAALRAIDLPWPTGAVRGLSVLLGGVAGLSAFFAWDRWRKVEAAIVDGRAAPPPRVHVVLAVAVAIAAAAVVVLALT